MDIQTKQFQEWIARTLFQTTTGIDLVHASLDTIVRGQIGNKGLVDFVTVFFHDISELHQYGLTDFVLRYKGLVQVHSRNRRTDDIEYVGLNLVAGIGQAIVGIVRSVHKDTVLDSNADLDKDLQ